LDFLERLIEEMPFPIQRIQSDRGLEFFAEKVQQRLMDWAIKFRPIKPRSPHLNGKVERSQRADLEEFWPTIDLRSPDLAERLAEWQHFWNWEPAPSAAKRRSIVSASFCRKFRLVRPLKPLTTRPKNASASPATQWTQLLRG
jgi:transposase InsO family protein